MKSKDAEDAVDSALAAMKSNPIGAFNSPMGRGIVIKTKPEYDYEGDSAEHHHFLTHGKDGKALPTPKHFVVHERGERSGDGPKVAEDKAVKKGKYGTGYH